MPRTGVTRELRRGTRVADMAGNVHGEEFRTSRIGGATNTFGQHDVETRGPNNMNQNGDFWQRAHLSHTPDDCHSLVQETNS